MAAGGATELERITVVLVGDGSSFQRMVHEAEASAKGLAASLARSGRAMTDLVTKPLKDFGSFAAGEFAEFDHAMTESTSIMGALTDEQVQRMREVALELSTRHAKSPAELAKAYYFLASAGLTAEQSISALQPMARFATAGAFELTTATDILTASLNALGLKVPDSAQTMENMARISDVLVRATTLAQGSTQQFGIALARDAGATLKMFNKDVEEGVAVLAAYADNNIKAEHAGNMFGRMTRMLTSAATRHAAAHEKLGFSVFDSAGQMRPYADIIENLEQIMAGMSDETKTVTLKQLGFQALMQRSLVPLIGMSARIREYEKELRSAGGITDHVAKKQMESLINQGKILKNIVAVAALEIGEMMAPAIRALSGAIKGAVDWWQSLSQRTKETAAITAAVLASIGPLILAFGLLTKAFTGLIFLRLIGEVAGLIAYLREDIDIVLIAWGAMVEAAAVAWNIIKAIVIVTAEAAKEGYGALIEAITGANEAFNEWVQGAAEWVVAFASDNEAMLTSFAGWAVVIGGVVAAVKLLILSWGVLSGVLAFFRLQQIAGAVAWGVYTAAATLAKVALWAVNAALTATSILLGGGIFIAMGGAVGLLAAGFVVVGSAIYAAYKAGEALFAVFADFRDEGGSMMTVLGPIGAMFKEWGLLLKDVYTTAQTDGALAWELLRAGAQLAISQVRDFLPPFWDFIKSGFKILWELVSSQFELAFVRAITRSVPRMLGFFNVFGALTPLITDSASALLNSMEAFEGGPAAVEEAAEKAKEAAEAARREAEGLPPLVPDTRTAAQKLKDLFQDFKFAESEATKEARKAVEGVQAKIAEAGDTLNQIPILPETGEILSSVEEDMLNWTPELPDDGSELVTMLEEAGVQTAKNQYQQKKWNDEVKKGKQEAQALDAVLFGSAEHQRRLADFREKIAENVVGGGKAGKDSEETQTDLLTDIRDILEDSPTVRVTNAGPEEGLA